MKKYITKKTKKAMATVNNLYYSNHNDLYYDLDLFESIGLDQDIKQTIINDMIKHNCFAWYEQPLPGGIIYNDYINYYYDIKTVTHRVWKVDGRRQMVIIEIVAVNIKEYSRQSIYDQEYKETGVEYDTKNYSYDYDIELTA